MSRDATQERIRTDAEFLEHAQMELRAALVALSEREEHTAQDILEALRGKVLDRLA